MTKTVEGLSIASAAISDQSQRTSRFKKLSFLSHWFGYFFSATKDKSKKSTTEWIPKGGLGNLWQMRLENVYIPRVDIVSVPKNLALSDLVKQFNASGHSRLPVYDDTLDNPIGMIHLKDLALEYGFSDEQIEYDPNKVIRPLLFAPPSMSIGVLLQKMKKKRRHMALIIDEYGGVDGLVTIEDLIEQVLGEISDEHDVLEAKPWVCESKGVYLVRARASLAEFEKVLGLDLAADIDDEDIETMGGFVFSLARRIPVRGEIVSHSSGYEFEIVDADPRRIRRLRVRRSRPNASDAIKIKNGINRD